MVEGWIKLHRVITTKDIYIMNPLYLRVFERLILEANHQCKRIPYNKTTRLVRRGERLTSIRQIAEWVSWYERGIQKVPNPKTISEILKWLVQNELIEILKLSNGQETHYNIVNYSIYQATESNQSNSKVTAGGEVSKQRTDTNKNDKNLKNEKINIYTAEFEKFYSFYPNPQNKNQTYTNWKACLKENTVDEIVKAANEYKQLMAKEGRERKFIKSSSNFLGKDKLYKEYLPKQPLTKATLKLVVRDEL